MCSDSRPILAMVLILSGCKMVHLSNLVVGSFAVVLAGVTAVMIVRGSRQLASAPAAGRFASCGRGRPGHQRSHHLWQGSARRPD